MLDYPVDQNGDTLVSLLLRLLVSGFLGLLTLKKCILSGWTHPFPRFIQQFDLAFYTKTLLMWQAGGRYQRVLG